MSEPVIATRGLTRILQDPLPVTLVEDVDLEGQRLRRCGEHERDGGVGGRPRVEAHLSTRY